jgi:hypothetical protein
MAKDEINSAFITKQYEMLIIYREEMAALRDDLEMIAIGLQTCDWQCVDSCVSTQQTDCLDICQCYPTFEEEEDDEDLNT